MEKITVTSRSEEIITAKSGSGSKYFMLADEMQRELICFIPELHEYLMVGTGVDVDIAPPRKEGGTPQVTQVYKDGKPVIKPEAKTVGRSYGKSKEELLQIRQLAEAQNRSIQAQVSLKTAVDLAVANIGTGDLPDIKDTAREFYQLLQSLTQITEAEVIHRELKSTKTPTEQAGQSPREEPRADDSRGDKDTKERIKELYQQKGWWTGREWTSPEVVKHIKGITGRLDINKASEDELINILSDLQARKEDITE